MEKVLQLVFKKADGKYCARRKLKTACADKTMKKQPDRAVFSLPFL